MKFCALFLLLWLCSSQSLPTDPNLYAQCDPQWSSVMLSNTNFTICEKGSHLVILAYLFRRWGRTCHLMNKEFNREYAHSSRYLNSYQPFATTPESCCNPIELNNQIDNVEIMNFLQMSTYEKPKFLYFPDLTIEFIGPSPISMLSKEMMVILKMNDGRLTLVVDVWFAAYAEVNYLIWDPITNTKETLKPTTELHFMVRTQGSDSTKCLLSDTVAT